MEEAATLKDEGNAKFKVGEYQAAIDAYTRSLDLDPEQHLCYSNRSAAYLKLGGSAEEALGDAEKCVEIAPKWAKGYNRQAAALQELKRWDEAKAACEKGLAQGPDDALSKMLAEVQQRHFQGRLCGTWHGTVNEVLGGYDQEMEFMDNNSVRVAVLGRSIIGRYWINVTHEPHHLDIQVPMGDVPPGCPPPPAVPYIARIDEKGLHLCCPFMKMERPTEFEGPGYCLMLAGGLSDEPEGRKDIMKLPKEEQIKLCTREMTSALPSRTLAEPQQTDTEDETRDKLMAQVKFETNMFAVQKRFGEDVMKEVLNATRGEDVPACLKGTEELDTLKEGLRRCGILDDAPTPAPVTASPPPKPPQEPTFPDDTVPPRAGKDKSLDADETSGKTLSDSGSSMQVVIGASIAVAAVAGVAFLLWRRQKR